MPTNAFFAALALGGCALSLAVHIAALCGVDVLSLTQSVWVLHAGIFVVFVPMLLQLRHSSTVRAQGRAALWRGLPAWVGFVAALLIAYAVLNFFVFSGGMQGSPAIRDGLFVLENKGQAPRAISESEYHALQAAVMRAFSGHWLLFYFIAFAHFALRRPAAHTFPEPVHSAADVSSDR